MLPPLVDDRPNMVVCQRIENGFSLSSALYKLVLLQDPKLVFLPALADCVIIVLEC